LIGNTPLVPIERLNPNPNVTVLAKLESFNPGGSVKDRVALAMIEAAEKSGELTPQKTLLEATSGNTGIGLATVAAVKGYRIVLAMSEAVSIERRKILGALGAEFLLTPAEHGTDGAIELAYELAGKEPHKYLLTDQYNNDANIMAHYRGTSEEIWRQTDGKVTHFIATLGTTGTIVGNGRRLRELNPNIEVIAVEPHLGHRIQGLKNLKEAYVPGIYDPQAFTRKVNVDDDAAYEMARELARKEGLLVGMSAGAAMSVALEHVKTLESGVVVVMLPDGGERYLSTTLFQVAVDTEPQIKLHFTNSFTRRSELFKPLSSERVTIYTCGPTVHALPHLGLYRRIVVADLVRRTVELAGHQVHHVMNVTDLDDRTLEAAEAAQKPLYELTDAIRQDFMEDLATLRVKPAEAYPKASEHVDDMVTLTAKLVQKGVAYEKHRSVYFEIGKFSPYGKLSGVDLEKIKLGATVDLDRYEKDDPRDFTLFKRSTLAEIKRGVAHRTSWGNVRPGWHIECATMAMSLLGEQTDIHVGGVDLIFPHHENEIAICQSLTSKSPANYWIHSGLVMVDGRKMSRSAENAVTVRDLLARGFSGRQVRFFLLSPHYRQPLHYSEERFNESCESLERLDECVRKLRQILARDATDNDAGCQDEESGERRDESARFCSELEARFREALFDDLNIAGALAAVFQFIRQINRCLDRGHLGREPAERIYNVLRGVDEVLGVLENGENDVSDAAVDALVEKREQARLERDFAQADALRSEIESRGVVLEDTPSGPRVRKG
jgi:cysteinyl-tRNA synthetase